VIITIQSQRVNVLNFNQEQIVMRLRAVSPGANEQNLTNKHQRDDEKRLLSFYLMICVVLLLNKIQLK
jgi:hypothetical protein